MKNSAKDIKEEVVKVSYILTVLTELQDIYSEYHRLKIFQEMGHYILLEVYIMLLVLGWTISSFIKEIVIAQFIPMSEVLYNFFCLPGVLQKTLEYVKKLKIEKDLSNFFQEIWREKESKYEGNKFLEKHSKTHLES